MNKDDKILELVIPFNEINKADDLGNILRELADEYDMRYNSKMSLVTEFSVGYIRETKENIPVYKKCNTCGKYYEATTKNFYKINTFVGLHPTCISCKQKEQNEKYETKKRKKEEEQNKLEKEIRKTQEQNNLNKSNKTKICTRCKEEKPLKEFYNSSRSEDGKNNVCKDCEKKRKEQNKIKKMEEEN